MRNIHYHSGMIASLCAALIFISGQMCTTVFAAAQEAKIGLSLSMTGGAAAYGATQKRGAELAVDEINAAAGASRNRGSPFSIN